MQGLPNKIVFDWLQFTANNLKKRLLKSVGHHWKIYCIKDITQKGSALLFFYGKLNNKL